MDRLRGRGLAGEQLVRAAAAAALNARAGGPEDGVAALLLLGDRHGGQLRLTGGRLSHLPVLVWGGR